MICSRCGYVLGPFDKLCGRCGFSSGQSGVEPATGNAPTAPAPSPTRTGLIPCSACGQEVSVQAVACPKCGQPIAPREYAPPQSAPAYEGNGSGRGAQSSPLPQELRGFSWGGLLLGVVWAIAHNVWIGLVALVPYVGFVMLIFLGVNGNEWAWQNRRWESIEQFKEVQHAWTVAGIICLVIATIGSIASWAIIYRDPR